jgi:hypothetical protein
MFAAVALAVLTVLPGSAMSSIGASHPGITSQHVTVHSGDSLSAISARVCHGNASDWTGIYHVNRKVIGNDPNLIYPGQFLVIPKCTHADPPGYTPAGRPLHVSGKIWGITYGYPNYCGDGDKDGWDEACGHSHASSLPVASSAAYSGSGVYSYSGLENLWVSAGGPSWAEAAAATIAECESGGRVYAYNPSGATGLWQILGQVVGGNLWNPYVNALNAVSKFTASGDTFAQWVCKA